jgi:hypothetical protein
VKITSETVLLWKEMENTCGIIDTACKLNAVTLTLHAKHDSMEYGCTIRAARASLKGNIYQKHIGM